MKNLLFIALAIFSASMANAQSKDRQVIANAGGYITTPTAIVSYTLGETAINYLSNPGASLSQGFQQASNAGASIEGFKNLDAVVSTFPNPFVDFVEIKTDKMLDGASFRLVDAMGKTIQISPSEISKGKHWRIDIASLASGNYLLSIIAKGKQGTYTLTHISQ